MIRVERASGRITAQHMMLAITPTLAGAVFLALVVVVGTEATQIIEGVGSACLSAYDVVNVSCGLPAARHGTAI
jgi:hypothetical protein